MMEGEASSDNVEDIYNAEIAKESNKRSNESNTQESSLTKGEDMKDISVEDETGDIEVAEAHGSDDDVIQEDAIANEASSGAIEDANSAQMVADSDAVSNELKIYEPVTEGEDMKDSDANTNEVISDTLEDATGREDGVLQVDAIANELSSDAIEDADIDQVAAESDAVSNQPSIYEPATEGEARHERHQC